MHPHADREIDEDLKKGAVESTSDRPGSSLFDQPQWLSASVALTEDVTTADPAQVKHAEEELGADDDGTPG